MCVCERLTSITSQVVKLGLASEEARLSAANDDSNTASQKLLADYSVTSGAATPLLRTPRTPASKDTILQEAQNLIALQHVQTPLKGGENTPLRDSTTGTGFEGIQPAKQAVQTPNVVLGTPFRTPGSQVGSPDSTLRMMTPRGGGVAGAATPGQTPVRDQLSINLEETLGEGFESVGESRQQQMEIQAQLRAGLKNLPAPRNEFEIVVPDEEGAEEWEGRGVEAGFVEDAADIDARKEKIRKAEGGWCESG